ncbi:MAG TPA: hypothetical protein VMR34_01645 [Candidatus Saccharimonadales bacterium]|nr:hypothetical protein [Candidatus Saccharimonadales bacterium]
MIEKQTSPIETIDSAQTYINDVRSLYRASESDYRGRRSEDQQTIAEVSAEDGELIVDSVVLGMLSLGSLGLPSATRGEVRLPAGYETNVTVGDFDWKDFRGSFSRLLAGFGVLTDRLEKKGLISSGYSDFHKPERL